MAVYISFLANQKFSNGGVRYIVISLYLLNVFVVRNSYMRAYEREL